MFDKKELKDIPNQEEIEELSLEEMKFVIHFYDIRGVGDWYVVSAEEYGDDIIFFGYVKLLYDEWGSFTLSQLKNEQMIIRDQDWSPKTIGEL